MTPAVKICGLTTPETLEAALGGGAAFVGAVVFPRSPRHIAPDAAGRLFERARGRAKIVAVTVDADDGLLGQIARDLRPDFIQLHGAETRERAEAVRVLTGAGVIKALPVRTADDIEAAAGWESVADHLMFDAKPPEGSALPGGVGASFDWALLAGRTFARPWFLAGGLTCDNVREAIAVTGAPLLDVSSGVESAAGVKDAALIAAFIQAAKQP
ncbi:MAG: phosphoribosylanthranilate isomerase [Pseudomonadota bacterium]